MVSSSKLCLFKAGVCFLPLCSTCLTRCLSLVDTVREKSERDSSPRIGRHCTPDDFSRGKTGLNSEHDMDKWEFTAQEQVGVVDAKLVTGNIQGGGFW